MPGWLSTTVTLVKSFEPVLQTRPVTVRELPTLVTIGLAQAFVTLRLGAAHTTLKLHVARLVTLWAVLQMLAPIAVTVLTMLLRPHKLGLTVKVAFQGAVAPMPSEPRVRTVEPVKSSVSTHW